MMAPVNRIAQYLSSNLSSPPQLEPPLVDRYLPA